jgi:hypothetical protein
LVHISVGAIKPGETNEPTEGRLDMESEHQERTVVDFRKEKYARVTKTVITNTEQLEKPADIAVYTVLCMYADNDGADCNPKIETIATMSRCSVRTVKRSLERLKAAEYLDIEHRFNKYGHRASSRYYLLEPKVPKNTDPSAK